MKKPQLAQFQVFRDRAANDDIAQFQCDPADRVLFGQPPSFVVGCLTAFVGAVAGIVSLLLFFTFFDPSSRFSWDWLLFIFIGSAAGFFLRVEEPLLKEIENSSNKQVVTAQPEQKGSS